MKSFTRKGVSCCVLMAALLLPGCGSDHPAQPRRDPDLVGDWTLNRYCYVCHHGWPHFFCYTDSMLAEMGNVWMLSLVQDGSAEHTYKWSEDHPLEIYAGTWGIYKDKLVLDLVSDSGAAQRQVYDSFALRNGELVLVQDDRPATKREPPQCEHTLEFIRQ